MAAVDLEHAFTHGGGGVEVEQPAEEDLASNWVTHRVGHKAQGSRKLERELCMP